MMIVKLNRDSTKTFYTGQLKRKVEMSEEPNQSKKIRRPEEPESEPELSEPESEPESELESEPESAVNQNNKIPNLFSSCAGIIGRGMSADTIIDNLEQAYFS
jgi:hypothetical protein